MKRWKWMRCLRPTLRAGEEQIHEHGFAASDLGGGGGADEG